MNARDLALSVVRDVFPQPGTQERGAQAALDYRSRKSEVSGRDRAFATELAYGAIKMRRTLDWYLKPFIGERAQPPPPAIAEILRLAVFELMYTRADEHATVFEFVNLAKKYGHRGVANLVNAVLRSILRDRPLEPERHLFESDADYLGTRYSLPTWLVKQWGATFDADALEAICAAVNEPARSAITVNAATNDRETVVERLRAAGQSVVPSAVVPESILLDDAAYARGKQNEVHSTWWIQSESSAMPADVLQPGPDERVLDVCSGRGNKALQIGGRMRASGTLVCIERDARKAEVLQERLNRAGMAAAVVVGDACDPGILPADQRFDRLLLDAPCSGLGVVGRHPESRWKKQPEDGERLASTQRALLEACAAHLFEGGALVYAVCSTDPRETTEVVEWFLGRHNFERGLIPGAYDPWVTAAGDVLVPPGLEGRDGFFIARLDRRT